MLPMDPTEARKIKKNSNRFTLVDGELYRFGFTHPILVCVHGEKCMRIMAELHKGICGSHIGGRALATRTLRRLLLAHNEGCLLYTSDAADE